MSSKRKLQVFISSTFTDMQDERQSAVSAVLKAGHIPAGMELFTAGDQSQTETIERWIDESDVYLLILGGRYGSISPQNGLSYTENEYDYAIAAGKPLFSIIIDDQGLIEKSKRAGASVLEKSDPGKLSLFRKKVESKLCAYFSDAKDIRLAVYESLQDFSLNRDLEGWVRASELRAYASLSDDVERLRIENTSLSAEVERLKLESSIVVKSPVSNGDFADTMHALDNEKVVWPESLKGENNEHSVVALLKNNRGLYTTGMTSTPTSSELNKFFARYIIPKYISHKLMSFHEDAKGRRYQLTERGHDFLAWLDQEQAAKAAKTVAPLQASNSGPSSSG